MASAENLVTFGQRVNDFLQRKLENLPDEPRELKEAVAYALLQGGKRVRPYLVYTVGRAFNASVRQLDYPAAAVECIHAYSLIHDDMPEMDNDLLRRGQPTVHAKFGPATALLAGDTLQALAFEILSDDACTIAGEVKAKLCACLARGAGFSGMCGGQALDLKAEHHKLTQSELEHMHALKTGALILAAVKLGYMTARYQEAYDNALGDSISQGAHLGEAVLKADVHVVGVGGEKAEAPVLLQKRQGPDVYTVVVVGQLQAGKHAPDQGALAGAGLADDADELVKGGEIELHQLHAQGVHTGVTPGGEVGADNMAFLQVLHGSASFSVSLRNTFVPTVRLTISLPLL